MERTSGDVANLLLQEEKQGNTLVSVSLIVKDGNSGDIKVYNSSGTGGIDEYYDYNV